MTHAVSTEFGDEDSQWQHRGALATRHLRDLFNRLPSLAGFRLRSDLMVADVSVVGRSDCLSIRRLQVTLTQAFVELMECNPEAVVLMRGRTFARAR
jgi:hypothetical protein